MAVLRWPCRHYDTLIDFSTWKYIIRIVYAWVKEKRDSINLLLCSGSFKSAMTPRLMSRVRWNRNDKNVKFLQQLRCGFGLGPDPMLIWPQARLWQTTTEKIENIPNSSARLHSETNDCIMAANDRDPSQISDRPWPTAELALRCESGLYLTARACPAGTETLGRDQNPGSSPIRWHWNRLATRIHQSRSSQSTA